MSNLARLVPSPSADSVNSGLSPLHQSTMMELFGAPTTKPEKDCADEITNKKLADALVRLPVSDFIKVTGHFAAVKSLKKILDKVQIADPELYAVLRTDGMLCARLVRGSKTSWSNHSWGFAVDLKIGTGWDEPGDNKTQVGLLRLYPYFHAEGWYWGTEFSREDSMHFEVANETILAWKRDGLLKKAG